MKAKVLAKRDGFRRLGRAFSDTVPTYIDVKELSKAELETLKSDPSLLVMFTEVEDEHRPSEADVSVLTSQLEESKVAMQKLVDEQAEKLAQISELKQEIASLKNDLAEAADALVKEKAAHAETSKAVEAAKAATNTQGTPGNKAKAK